MKTFTEKGVILFIDERTDDAVVYSGGSWRIPLDNFVEKPDPAKEGSEVVWLELDSDWKPTFVRVWPSNSKNLWVNRWLERNDRRRKTKVH